MSTHKKSGDKYFDYVVPEEKYDNPRLKGCYYNFFQYLGPKKTRHLSFWNTDPVIDYVPSTFGNYMMSQIYYQTMVRL